MKNFIRSIIPQSLLNFYRQRKKHGREKQLQRQRLSGKAISSEQIFAQLMDIGIAGGDSLLVHSSMSKIGLLENGPDTFVSALKNAVGPTGNILMPTSPNAGLQLEFARKGEIFDVINTPAKTGAICEYFRKQQGVIRSLHPTEPVAVSGPLADWFTQEHFGQLTPYNSKSPFARLSQKNGKILYVGVTFDNAGTNLHTIEDAVDFKFPVYFNEIFEFQVIDAAGNRKSMKSKVHNPEYSVKRKCDQLMPLLESRGALRKVKIGQATSLLVLAGPFFEILTEAYQTLGVTMYTPHGSK